MPTKKTPPSVILSETKDLSRMRGKKTADKLRDSSATPQNDKKGKAVGLTVPMYGVDGKEAGTLELSKEIFGGKVNTPLLAQALRVYQNNQKSHFANTKTRGEVRGSTRKIFKQKGTGNARHGAKRAPIFVGGGIALGPKFRKVELDLPKKMKRLALISALSSKMAAGEVWGVEVEKISGKTSQMAKLFKTLDRKNALVVIGDKSEKLVRAVSNLASVSSTTAGNLNVLEIIRHQSLVLTKEAVEKLESRINKSEPKEEK